MNHTTALLCLIVLICTSWVACSDDAEDGSSQPTTSTSTSSTAATSSNTSETSTTSTTSGPRVEPEESLEAYFLDSYDASRARFLDTSETLKTLYTGVTTRSLRVDSATDDDLTIDITTIPAQVEPRGLLIMSLGVHGVEAFAGSAVIHMFTAELLPNIDLSTTTVLFVHAVNPWGFRHKRRVSENNVDLNRNMSVSADLFDIENVAYGEIDAFLNPTEVVDAETVERAFGEALSFAVDQDRAVLQQAILQGQYTYPLGIFFGGVEFEPQRDLLQPIFQEAIDTHEKVFLMDFHTGFGERGKLHLFGAPGLGTPLAIETIFEGYEIDTGENDENFYETDGDMILYVGDLTVNAGKDYIGMTMEYGTLDSQTDIGAIQSLVNTKLENQGHHHGYSDLDVETNVKDTFLRSYYPIETEWRVKIMSDTRDMLPVLIDRFIALHSRVIAPDRRCASKMQTLDGRWVWDVPRPRRPRVQAWDVVFEARCV